MIRSKIAEELKDEMFGLMVDIATKNNRSILGVNTQMVIDGKIVVRTIGMNQIVERHTSDNITNDITSLLTNDYHLGPEQVYGFSSDNAYNMARTGDLLDAEACVENEGPRLLTEAEYEDAILNMYTDCEFYADLISNVAEKYAERNRDIHIKEINKVGCASHTLHLAVEQGIRSTYGVPHLISDARDMIKKLRTPSILHQIMKTDFKLPQIDVPTRWNSKFIMVNYISSQNCLIIIKLFFNIQINSLWELKPFVEEMEEADGKVWFDKWDELKDLIDVLAIPYLPSIKIQAEQCTLTDMWAAWNLLLLQLEKNSSALAQNIRKSLIDREHVIKNPTMFAALFLDPRYKSVLKQPEQQVAICELLSLHNKIERKKTQNNQQEREIDELELMLMAAEINESGEEVSLCESRTAIQREFDHFKRLKRLDKDSFVLEFWQKNKAKFPCMYELARVVFSVSNGQTSVERAFSALDFIYDRRRCNLDPDILNDILIIRLNSTILDNLNDSEWDVIIQKQLDQDQAN